MPVKQENREKDCLIDPDSDEYDLDDEVDKYITSEFKWRDKIYNVGVRIEKSFLEKSEADL